jgi:choline dehydrogenase-like flavoprotein
VQSLTASKELVLSAGSIGTPTILMHSGIGDSTELSTLGITPLHNLPSVGKNLTDHPLLGTSYSVNTTDTPDDIVRNATLTAFYERQWNVTRTGPFSSSSGNWIGWFRFNLSSPAFRGIGEDPSSGPHAPHYEILAGVSNVILHFSGMFH